MDLGRQFLGKRQVQAGVESIVHEVQVEGTFPDGTKLVTVHSPINREDGDLTMALYGRVGLRRQLLAGAVARPLQIRGTLTINEGREVVTLQVTNLADRPIQVGSHYHLVEVNPRLELDRGLAYGRRLNIPAGTAVRFEPGECKSVPTVLIGGRRVIRGGNNIVDGAYDPSKAAEVVKTCEARGFKHKPQDEARAAKKAKTDGAAGGAACGATVDRAHYAEMFGPTTGDRVHLGDTGLVVEVEKDFTRYGDECKFGGGKVLRDGMGQAAGHPAAECLDCVITNALVVDYTGIFKCDIGIRDGRIAALGKAGNPDVMEGVTPGMTVGPGTEAIAGEGHIVTYGGMDTHIHYICPQQAYDAIAAGTTTLYGGGTGPAAGTSATTCTPGAFYTKKMLQATDCLPLNFGFSGKGNASKPEGLDEMIQAGCAGLKLHEDWGTTPAAIDSCLAVADKYDVQVTIHTDTLNESCCLEETVAAFKGRAIHTYHSEGAGGGHAPDIIAICGEPNVVPGSTNPTMPYTANTIDEHVDMLMVCHHLSKNNTEDVAFAESRIRGSTIAAEDVLHDMGAISIMSSDSQAMGRIGEVGTRTWQTAAKMKLQRGPLPEDAAAGNDNFRVRRYVAKYTINPAIAHGVGEYIGSVEAGKLADLVLWDFAHFGSKPQMVLKGGVIAWAQMGDPNASIPTPQPVMMRPMFAGLSQAAIGPSSLVFVSKASIDSKVIEGYKLSKTAVAVKGCRTVGKKDMKLNDALPKIAVNPETYVVTADGVEVTCQPAQTLPLTRRFFLF